MGMTYAEIAKLARGKMGSWCRACPDCDGRACGAHVPGPGAKGSGIVATRNREAWGDLRLLMDTIYEGEPVSCATVVLGRELRLPVMVAPVGDVKRHYGAMMTDIEYNECVLRAASAAGTVAWTGDGVREEIVECASDLVASLGGCGVLTIKPWPMDVTHRKVARALSAHPMAVAMDIDGAGLPFLRDFDPPAGPKSMAELGEIADQCHDAGTPFVLKGVLGPHGAEKAVRAGADAIVVSNHGGRVLDGVPATAHVLPLVADAVGDDATVLVDGGVRTGIDVFRALALGASGALVCRPFVVCIYGAGEQGVRSYVEQLALELEDAMRMCGARTVDQIDQDMLLCEGSGAATPRWASAHRAC